MTNYDADDDASFRDRDSGENDRESSLLSQRRDGRHDRYSAASGSNIQRQENSSGFNCGAAATQSSHTAGNLLTTFNGFKGQILTHEDASNIRRMIENGSPTLPLGGYGDRDRQMVMGKMHPTFNQGWSTTTEEDSHESSIAYSPPNSFIMQNERSKSVDQARIKANQDWFKPRSKRSRELLPSLKIMYPNAVVSTPVYKSGTQATFPSPAAAPKNIFNFDFNPFSSTVPNDMGSPDMPFHMGGGWNNDVFKDEELPRHHLQEDVQRARAHHQRNRQIHDGWDGHARVFGDVAGPDEQHIRDEFRLPHQGDLHQEGGVLPRASNKRRQSPVYGVGPQQPNPNTSFNFVAGTLSSPSNPPNPFFSPEGGDNMDFSIRF